MSPRDTNDTDLGRCGILDTIELLGGRYKLLIVRALLFEGGPLRFSALKRALPGVSQKTLTRNLRDLEASGLLTRTVFAEVPPRVEYELTEAGTSLMSVFRAMDMWASHHLTEGRPAHAPLEQGSPK